MKKFLQFIVLGGITASLAGCFFMHRSTVGVAILPLYSGPKASVVLADFDVKAAKATGEMGCGLREMLAAAITDTNRFLVVERQQAQAQVVQPKELFSAATAGVESQKATVKNADLIIAVAVTEFEPQASGGRAGIGGGGGGGSGALGGLMGSALNKAHIGLDISIVDALTSKTLAVTHVQGQASDVSGTEKGGSFGSGGLGAGLSAYANTPMDKAIRICIIEAIRYIYQSTPATYYKYNSDGKT